MLQEAGERWNGATGSGIAPEPRQGDLAGVFVKLYLTQYDRLRRRVTSLLGPWREDAEDLTQQTFLLAWRGLPEVLSRGDFRPEPWLSQIAANAVRMHLRRCQHPAYPSLSLTQEAVAQWAEVTAARSELATASAEATVLRREQAAAFQAALGRLPEREAQLVTGQAPYQRGGAWAHELHQAREHFRQCYQAQG